MLAGTAPALAAPCSPADFTGDGQIDFSDYLEFLNLYDASDPAADLNQDGQIDFADYLEFLNLYDAGCPSFPATVTQLAGRVLSGHPYIEFVDAYNDGQVVQVAVDPARHPGLTGATTRVYVTAARTAAQWSADPTLTDLRPGGFQPVTWPGGTLQGSYFPITGSAELNADAGESIGRPYDVVIDVNSNGMLDAGDLIDGAASSPAVAAGFYKLSDMTTPGPAAVTTIPLVSIPEDRVRDNYERSRWYYPSDIATRGQLPVVFVSVHSGDIYTWHDHLGTFIASYGFIVVVPQNGACGASCLIADATCLLDHVNTLVDLQGTLGGGVLNGHIDPSEVLLIGHTLGGETCSIARNRLLAGIYNPTGGYPRVIDAEDIKYICMLGPTDFRGPGENSPGDVDLHFIYGAANGDVSGTTGNDITQAFNLFERGTGRRSSTYIHGADANDFSCCGFEDFVGPAGTAIGRPEAQRIQRAVTLASILHYRRGNLACREVLHRQWESFRPLGMTMDTTVVHEMKDSAGKLIIDDFQDAVNSPDVCSNPAWSASFAGVAAAVEGPRMDDTNNVFTAPGDTWNGMTRARVNDNTDGVVFEYDATLPSRAVTFTAASAVDATAYGALSFRLCQMTRHPLTIATLADQDFEVEIEDAAGRTSRIRIGVYGGGIEEPYQRTGAGTGAGWQNEFETVRIHLADFASGTGSGGGGAPDLASLKHIRFLFGSAHGTPTGRLALDDLELTGR